MLPPPLRHLFMILKWELAACASWKIESLSGRHVCLATFVRMVTAPRSVDDREVTPLLLLLLLSSCLTTSQRMKSRWRTLGKSASSSRFWPTASLPQTTLCPECRSSCLSQWVACPCWPGAVIGGAQIQSYKLHSRGISDYTKCPLPGGLWVWFF